MSEDMLIQNCAPTLAGIKTGSLFRCSGESEEELREDIRRLNRALHPKGVRVLPLQFTERGALIYLYRPRRLKEDLSHGSVEELLRTFGYYPEKPERCIAQLIRRLESSDGFPHEIGLFLGYPPEDVWGFIQNDAKNCKYVGAWKVYGDAEKAQKLFQEYKQCTQQFCVWRSTGATVEQLTAVI